MRNVVAAWLIPSMLGLMCSHPAAADAAQADTLERMIRERFPDIRIEGVHESVDLPGFYEIVTPDEIVYVDRGGTRLIMGNVMEIATRENLTAKRWYDINKIDFNSLPFERAIKIVKGDGSRQLAVFEDPFCPYCEEFEKTLDTIDNITVHVFLYPLEELHPGATDAAREIWCAEDHAAAWTAWMREGRAPAKTSIKTDCHDVPIEELADLGKRLKIYSTPTLFFADGLRVPGAIDAARLEKKLDSLQSRPAAPATSGR